MNSGVYVRLGIGLSVIGSAMIPFAITCSSTQVATSVGVLAGGAFISTGFACILKNINKQNE